MNARSTVLFTATLLTAIVAMMGCATSKPVDKKQQTQSMLIQAGFRAIPAASPGQVHQLQTLRPEMISPVKRDGKQYYVYPDFVQRILFVGTQSQYLAYKRNLSDMDKDAQYDSNSKSDPAAATYNNEMETLQANETFDHWKRTGWGSWDMPE